MSENDRAASDETPAGARVESPGATPLPALKPCPACGGSAELRPFTEAIRCTSPGCHAAGPVRDSDAEAADAWNALPRLADGLRPEPVSTGYALLDEAARHALDDTAETVAWLRRAVTVLAERHGVKLPPAPKRTGRAL